MNGSFIPFFWVLGGTLVVLALSFFIVLIVKSNVKRIEQEKIRVNELKATHEMNLSSSRLEILDEERSRIAINLHDDLMSELHLIRLSNLQNVERTAIDSQIKKTLRKVRHISHDMLPPQIESIQLSDLISDYMFRIQPSMSHSFVNSTDDASMPVTIKLNVFRIFQEVISNIIKHSGASHVDVVLRKNDASISLLISDNGRGFSLSDKKGIGLKTIQYRCEQLGASHKYKSDGDRGTTFILSMTQKEIHNEKL